jgi:hypothetical protein
VTITRRVTHDGYRPAGRRLDFRLYDWDAPRSVEADGTALDEAADGAGWTYEPALRRLTVRVTEAGTHQTITVR